MTETKVRRPFGVNFIALLIIALGGLETLGGLLLLFQRTDNEVLNAIDVTSSQITTYAVFSIMFGVIAVLVGVALNGGASWARYMVGFLAAVRFFSLVWVVIAYHSVQWTTAIWPMVIYGFVAAYLLMDKDAQKFFASSS